MSKRIDFEEIKAKIIDALDDAPSWPAFEAAREAFKKPADQGGFDWNIFNRDGDDYRGLLAEARHNLELGKNLAGTLTDCVIETSEALEEVLEADETLSVIAEAVNRKVDIPKVPEWIERRLFGWLVPFLLGEILERIDPEAA